MRKKNYIAAIKNLLILADFLKSASAVIKYFLTADNTQINGFPNAAEIFQEKFAKNYQPQ
jgi:hypothetical protein